MDLKLESLLSPLAAMTSQQLNWLLGGLALVFLALLVRRPDRSRRPRFGGLKAALTTRWQLTILASTAFVLSCASGWTTWDGMRNFTGEPVLSGMITFGIQGVMLIIAWLIGESFAAGVSGPSHSRPWGLLLGSFLCAVGLIGWGLSTTGAVAFTGLFKIEAPERHAQYAMLGAALLAFLAGSASASRASIVGSYFGGLRIIARNAVLWVMFLACMATSVFFSFDSLFANIFPQEERRRAADIRAINQVSAAVADTGTLIARRRMEEAERLFAAKGWTDYDAGLTKLAAEAKRAPEELERLFQQRARERLAQVTRHEETKASALAQIAELERRKAGLVADVTRLRTGVPALSAAVQEKAAVVAEKKRTLEAARVAAEAESRGVEGTGKAGQGPEFRKRMEEAQHLQGELEIALLRLRDAERPFNEADRRLKQAEPELALIDGQIAKLRATIEAAAEQITAARESAKSEQTRFDATGGIGQLDRARLTFRQDPRSEHLAQIQGLCSTLVTAMSEVPSLKASARGIDCDPASASEAAARVFALNEGAKAFAATCAGGDKLPQGAGIDRLLEFAGRCVQDSGLPSQDTAQLRANLAAINLNRDDRAHRFVVTWNAFLDGNRLAYLALAIAIAIDSLVFMSGLFGAGALRSPLSDLEGSERLTADQLERIIDGAIRLTPDPLATIRTLVKLSTPTRRDTGFGAEIMIEPGQPLAEDVRSVLVAGSTIGAVEAADHSGRRFLVRPGLTKYFFEAANKHWPAARSEADLHEISNVLRASLVPSPASSAHKVLKHVEPLVDDADEDVVGKVDLGKIVDPAEQQVVRTVMNSGVALRLAEPIVDSGRRGLGGRRRLDDAVGALPRYRIHRNLYKALLAFRSHGDAIGPIPSHPAELGIPSHSPARAQLRVVSPEPRPALANPAPAGRPALTHQPAHGAAEHPAFDGDIEQARAYFWNELIGALHVEGRVASRRLDAEGVVDEARHAGRLLQRLAKANPKLARLIDEHEEAQSAAVATVYSRLRQEIAGRADLIEMLNEIDAHVQSQMPVLILFPENGLLAFLIERLEIAAGNDTGLPASEATLLDVLRHLAEVQRSQDAAAPQMWLRMAELLRSAEGGAGQLVPFPGSAAGGRRT